MPLTNGIINGLLSAWSHEPSSRDRLLVGRAILAGGLAAFDQTAPATRIEPLRAFPADGEIRGEWVTAGDACDDAVILYLHGSGYAACSARTHRGLVSRLSAASSLPAFSVDYRLAPRHRFPVAADDVRRAYDWLRARFDADQIVVAGDSAGGHLAIDLCLTLLREGTRAPAALALFSPLADVTLSLARTRDLAMPDPLASAASASRLVNHYICQADPCNPRLRHVFADGEILPPTLIQAGGAEMLAADAHHLHDQLVATGTECELEVWPGQMHVFQAMPRLVPEADRALGRAARFLAHHVDQRHIARTSTTEELGA